MSAPPYSELVYARGYLLSRSESMSEVKGWAKVETGGWFLSYDERVTVVMSAEMDNSVILIGNAFDPALPDCDESRIADVLLYEAKDSKEAFQRMADRLIGRYVVVLSMNGQTTIQQDATSMRAVYYTGNDYELVIGSHVHLVAVKSKATRNYFGNPHYLKENGTKTHPGLATAYLGIYRLTPNTELNPETRQVARVFPRWKKHPMSVSEASSIIIQAVNAQLKSLRQRNVQLMCSLSAGLDSRVSLALLKPYVENVLFFTYDIGYRANNNANKWDRDGALDLAAKHDLNHKLVHLPERSTDRAFVSAMRRNSAQTHQRSLAKAYLDELPTDHLHIRSNVYEVGRNYYRRAGFDMGHLDGAGMLNVVSHGASKDLPSIDAFEHYRNVTSFDSALEFGYDPLDLFYWEHRMGVWMAPILHESDIAHDTHILMNSRELLAALLSVSDEARNTDAISTAIILSRWPELLETPINGVPYESMIPDGLDGVMELIDDDAHDQWLSEHSNA